MKIKFRSAYQYLICFCILALACQTSVSAVEWSEGLYRTWDNREFKTYFAVGQYCVIHIAQQGQEGVDPSSSISDEQFADKDTLEKIVVRFDSFYKFYKDSLGFEPSGGNQKFGLRADVFLGAPSCGAGCGQVGSKGIEISGFEGIFNTIKYKMNVNADVIAAYEFGRNFFTFGDKVLFPFDPNDSNAKNGGFAEAFANLMVLYCFDAILKSPEERDLNETLINKTRNVNNFYSYINDPSANPLNSWARWDKAGLIDPSRVSVAGNFRAAYPSTGVLVGLVEFLGKNRVFPGVFKELSALPTARSIRDSLDNIAIAFSRSAGANYTQLFDSVLKFGLSEAAKNTLRQLPDPQNQLMPDKERLWLIEEKQKIPITARTVMYPVDNASYILLFKGSVISSNTHGNFSITSEFLGKEKQRTFELIAHTSGGIEIGRRMINIMRRQDLPLTQLSEAMYAYYTANRVTRISLESNGRIIFKRENGAVIPDHGLLWVDLPFLKGREYQVSGEYQFEASQSGSTFSFGFDSPAGSATQSFWKETSPDGFTLLNAEYPTDASYDNNWMSKYQWGRINVGGGPFIEAATVKNVVFRDITDNNCNGIPDLSEDFSVDSDGDGIEDFIDPEPLNFAKSETLVLNLRGEMDYFLPFDEVYVEPGYVAFDPKLGDVSSRVVVQGVVDNHKPGVYTLVYQVRTESGQAAVANRKVVVGPSMKLKVSAPWDNSYSRFYQRVAIPGGKYLLRVVTGSEYFVGDRQDMPALTPASTDPSLQISRSAWKVTKLDTGAFQYQRTIELNARFDGSISFAVLNYRPMYFYRVSLTDEMGREWLMNPSMSKGSCWIFGSFRGVYESFIDDTSPVIVLKGGATISIDSAAEYSDPGVEAYDNTEGDISNRVSIVGLPLPAAPGEYKIIYSVADVSGNVTTKTRRVIVGNKIPYVESCLIKVTGSGPVEFKLNASDQDGDPLQFIILSKPTNGVVSGNPPLLTYTPNRGFNGMDGILVKATDGRSESEVGTISFSVSDNGDVRILVLDSSGSGYARVVQSVKVSAGTYLFKVLTDKWVPEDYQQSPEFFQKEPASAPDPVRGKWTTRLLENGFYEISRTLTFSRDVSAKLVVSALNNLPRRFQFISLTSTEGLEVLLNNQFVSDGFWGTDGGRIQYIDNPAPPLLQNIRHEAGAIKFSVPSVSGFKYRFQRFVNLPSEKWRFEGQEKPGTGGNIEFEVPFGQYNQTLLRVVVY